MSNLFSIGQSVADMHEELAREQQAHQNDYANLAKSIADIRAALDALDSSVRHVFEVRNSAISHMLNGNGQ